MKNITIYLLLITSITSYAQFPESFDTGGLIPTGWIVMQNEIQGHEWRVSDIEDRAWIFGQGHLMPDDIAEDWLVTPRFQPTGGSSVLTFELGDGSVLDFQSQITIRISTSPIQVIRSLYTTVLTITETDTNGSLVSFNLNLSAYAGQQIYVAFVMENNDGDFWNLDNVDVSSFLSVDDKEKVVFKHHYNKHNETLHFKSSTLGLTTLEIYDVLGKKVLSNNFANDMEGFVDLSMLSNSVYFGKLYSGDKVETIKFVKY